MFTNKTLANHFRVRAFAPLADQKWITNALSYIKELDTITNRRTDIAGKQREDKPDAPANPASKRAAKRTARPWKKKSQGEEEEAQ